MRVEEHFHRRDFGHMDVTVTITDPKTFTGPFTINFVEELLPDTDVFEHICYENEKDAAHQPGGRIAGSGDGRNRRERGKLGTFPLTNGKRKFDPN